MSQEHLDAVQAVYDEWGRGNFESGPDIYDPLAVLVQGEGFPDKGAHLGIDGADALAIVGLTHPGN